MSYQTVRKLYEPKYDMPAVDYLVLYFKLYKLQKNIKACFAKNPYFHFAAEGSVYR